MLKEKILKKVKYRAVIIGAGNIASGHNAPGDKAILTHALAYRRHKKVDLAGFFDVNKDVAEKAAKKWHCRAFADLDEMFLRFKPDIVSICTPSEKHCSSLKEIAKYKPKIIICEKPVTTTGSDTKNIITIYNKIGVPVLVNYFRRFNRTTQIIKEEIAEEKYGKVICASGIYAKGLLNNGSHLIDLCCFLFGKIKNSATNYVICDYNSKDKSVAGFLEFEKCKQFHLMIGDSRKFSIFELDIIFEKARVCFLDFGFSISRQIVENNALYQGYRSLSKPITEKTNLAGAHLALIDNAIDHLENNKPLISDMRTAYQTQKICLSLIKN